MKRTTVFIKLDINGNINMRNHEVDSTETKTEPPVIFIQADFKPLTAATNSLSF